MPTVRVSPTYQVSIPREVRERLPLEIGQEVEVLLHDGRIEIVPVRPMSEARGFLRGLDPTVEREPDRA